MSRQRRRLATAATGWAFSSPYVALLLFFCLIPAFYAIYQLFEISATQTLGLGNFA